MLLLGVRHLISCLTSSPSFHMYDNCPWPTVSNIQVNCFIFEFLSYSTCFVPLLVSHCTLAPSLSLFLSLFVCLAVSFLACSYVWKIYSCHEFHFQLGSLQCLLLLRRCATAARQLIKNVCSNKTKNEKKRKRRPADERKKENGERCKENYLPQNLRRAGANGQTSELTMS